MFHFTNFLKVKINSRLVSPLHPFVFSLSFSLCTPLFLPLVAPPFTARCTIVACFSLPSLNLTLIYLLWSSFKFQILTPLFSHALAPSLLSCTFFTRVFAVFRFIFSSDSIKFLFSHSSVEFLFSQRWRRWTLFFLPWSFLYFSYPHLWEFCFNFYKKSSLTFRARLLRIILKKITFF